MTHRSRACKVATKLQLCDHREHEQPHQHSPDCDAITAALEATRRPTLLQCAEALALAGFTGASLKVLEWADIVDGWPESARAAGPQAQPGPGEAGGVQTPGSTLLSARGEATALPRGEVAEGATTREQRERLSPRPRMPDDERWEAENLPAAASPGESPRGEGAE